MLLLGAPASANTIIDFTSFHVLGDSLSDTGNVWQATFGAQPQSPPEWQGRLSHGPVWAKHVAARFEAEDTPTGNHAWGGASPVDLVVAPRVIFYVGGNICFCWPIGASRRLGGPLGQAYLPRLNRSPLPAATFGSVREARF